MEVELRNIHKTFGAVRANVGINLKVPAGTIQGILGENGAGKSTLMKILSGFIRADEGEILLDGKPVNISEPADAIHYGVGMLHQDPLDFPPMRIIDNFILGQPGGIFIKRADAVKELKELADQFGFQLDPEAYIDTLTVGERQQLEILRLLWLGARVLIFDEPTTGISALQKQKLFAALKLLAEQGKTILFVSHKLEDVEGLCHKIVVLRQGHLIGEVKPPYQTSNLVQMMFGKVIAQVERKPYEGNGHSTLVLRDVAVEDHRLKIEKVSLELRSGEVIGLAGMEGSGQDLFLRSVAGLVRTTHGHIILDNKDLTGRSYQTFKLHGTAFMPASRVEEGLAVGLNLTEHCVLAEKSRGFFVDWDEGHLLAQKKIEEFNIRGTPTSQIEELSGGNQQRALLALLQTPLKLLLLEHPTRGLDIESAIYIWSKLKERCKQGTSIIFISSDLEEILQYSDRVMVFFSGQVSAPLDAGGMTSETLGQLIGGKGWPKIISGKNE